MVETELQRALTVDKYPRSAKYDQRWVVDNLMGPHPLWSVEALMQVMSLKPGMRILDLGCGTALSSIFLAHEYDVEVYAADLWVKPTENWERIQAAGLGGRVHPIHANARDLPFAAGFFDAVVSIGAYHYFGTDAAYLAHCSGFVKPGGSIGIVVPGLDLEPGATLPSYLADRWVPELGTFFGPTWWRHHWERPGLVTVQVADMVPGGWEDWLRWLEACNLVGRGYEPDETMLRADGGRLLGLTRVVAQVR
ncbi:methyltransferase domain-containing protein [Kribbella turkmenica]|uniref:Methyltransferase domain-containing protein n=1 Tax=Kribbella turkmenica TaxID=2530375 RepID=A0A4R4XF71_9ACTN|nr:methyltransferase domain-containing protein [Kribbella turkmenica]TDD29528.1 methyltransferase domain-containing protein [Kribbella turkmenica]